MPLSHLLPGSYAGYTLTSSRHSVGSQMVSLNGTLLDNHALSYAVSQTRDRQNGSSGSLTAGYSSGRGDLNLGYSHDSQAARLNYGASEHSDSPPRGSLYTGNEWRCRPD